MTKREQLTAAATIGLPLGWLILLDTGWIHHWGWGWALLHVAVALACCAAGYAWMRYLNKT